MTQNVNEESLVDITPLTGVATGAGQTVLAFAIDLTNEDEPKGALRLIQGGIAKLVGTRRIVSMNATPLLVEPAFFRLFGNNVTRRILVTAVVEDEHAS